MASLLIEKPPGLRQRDRTLIAIDQLYAQFFLKLLNLSAKRRLGYMEQIGSS
ncbi:hypothetical protein RsS62_09100 [Rhizobium dioscoreae]|nr:hypothetical protein RsS62_09100 [Rhizobium dioscoreae]